MIRDAHKYIQKYFVTNFKYLLIKYVKINMCNVYTIKRKKKKCVSTLFTWSCQSYQNQHLLHGTISDNRRPVISYLPVSTATLC